MMFRFFPVRTRKRTTNMTTVLLASSRAQDKTSYQFLGLSTSRFMAFLWKEANSYLA